MGMGKRKSKKANVRKTHGGKVIVSVDVSGVKVRDEVHLAMLAKTRPHVVADKRRKKSKHPKRDMDGLC